MDKELKYYLQWVKNLYTPKGVIKDFPKEVICKMVEHQFNQGYKPDVVVFEKDKRASEFNNGFNWENTPEKNPFWVEVIRDKKFNKFFERYPKEESKEKTLDKYLNWIKNEYTPKGQIKGFPKEVICKMVEHQFNQGNKPDVGVFEKKIFIAFNWESTPEKKSFWGKVIRDKKFDVFFRKYPKEESKEKTLDKYLNWIKNEYTPKGQIKGFPKEVICKMVERQTEQENKLDVKVFEKLKNSSKFNNGFDWESTPEKWGFWYKVTTDKKFDKFFERYPKEETNKLGDEITIGGDKYILKRIVETIRKNGYYLHNIINNGRIFQKLKIDKRKLQKEVLGYANEGSFPYCNSLEDLNKFVSILKEKYKEKTLEEYLDWIKNEYTPKGEIKDFPKEVICKMVEHQFNQGNKPDVEVFEGKKSASKYGKGFSWGLTPEYAEQKYFWNSVITIEKFDIFFKRYPKEYEEEYYKNGKLHRNVEDISNKKEKTSLEDYLNWIKNDYIPKGVIKDFPKEVICKMVQRQNEQGNEPDVNVFEKRKTSGKVSKGFYWDSTPEKRPFWIDVISNEKFDKFFERYPKEEESKQQYLEQFYFTNLATNDGIIIRCETKQEIRDIAKLFNKSIKSNVISCSDIIIYKNQPFIWFTTKRFKGEKTEKGKNILEHFKTIKNVEKNERNQRNEIKSFNSERIVRTDQGRERTNSTTERFRRCENSFNKSYRRQEIRIEESSSSRRRMC